MKKRIFIIILSIILIAGVTLFLFRHVIIGHAFKVTISKKTNKTITINIGHVHYSVINSSVSFTDSKLSFNNTYLNKEETIELSELKFDEIKFDGLSLLNLIFKREVIADKFIVAKPSLWFSENDNPIPFKKRPKEIINSLKEHHDILGNLTIIVDEIEITNGIIDLKSIINAEEHSGSVEFKLLLKNFNTSKENVFDEDRILFAEDHFVKLSNFNYTLPNGDKVSFDSVVFKSISNRLITSNIRMEVHSNSIHSKFNPIITEVREILIKGIGFDAIEKMHEINIDSISISDVYLNITKNDSVVPKVLSDTSIHKRNLFSVMQSLNLNSFMLNNVNLLNRNTGGDTIIIAENLNFSVGQIKLDSLSLAKKIPDIDYTSISMSSGLLKVFEKKSGLKISLNDFIFTEKEGIISLAGLQINDHGANGSNKFITDVGSIEVSGVSVKDFVVGQPLKINLLISNPIVDFDLSPNLRHKGAKNIIDLGEFEISEVKISNGLIHLFKDNSLDVSIAGLDINSGEIQLNDFNKIHEINTDGLTISTSDIKIHMPDKHLLLTSGSLSVLNNTLTISDISGNFSDKRKINSSIFINQLQLGGANIGKLIGDKEIDLKYVKIIRPRFDGSLNLVSDSNSNSNKKPAHKFDYKVNIDDFELIGGKVDLSLNLKHDVVKLKSGVDIIVDNIKIADNKDTTWLNKLLWKVNLSRPVINYQDYLISCENVVSDNGKELLLFEDIEISDKAGSNNKSEIDIRKLSIKSIELSGLKYNSILEKQTPVMKTISIQNPFIDLKIDSRYKKITDDTPVQKPKFSIPFVVDEFEISNLSFKVEKQDSISVSNFSLSNLDFKYNMSSEDNIVDGLNHFSATNFLFSDTIKNSFADVKKLSFNQQEQKINISDISGGSINKQFKSDNYLSYASTGLNISGIDISQEAPHDFNIKGIEIDDFQLDIENHKTTTSTSGSSAKKKIKLPGFISSLGIDIISCNNIDVNHITVTDSSVKKLTLTKLGFLINSIKIDSNTIANNDFAFAEQVSVNLKDNKFISSDSLYETSVNSISYNFSENILKVDSLMMKPRYEPSEFFKKAVYQTGKMDIVTDKIICSNLRLKKLISDGSIHMGGVDIFGLDMRIFRNKKYEMNPDLYKKMPQEALLSVPRTLTIDSLKTHDAYIQYRQLSPKSVVPGEIFLNEVYLSIFNINNDLKVIDETSSMVALFNAKLLGESDLKLKLTLPILSPAHDFWVTGHVDNIDFTKLNSMTRNLVGVTMERGTGELDIPLISGNSQHSEGSILFKYRKLKIELYDRYKAKNTTGLTGSMANLLLNDIFIKSNNPGFLGKTKPGEVYFKRNTQKSIVYYTWKSILSGLMSTMGYNNKEQRHEKRASRRKRK